jgi:hypothetical protein
MNLIFIRIFYTLLLDEKQIISVNLRPVFKDNKRIINYQNAIIYVRVNWTYFTNHRASGRCFL